MNSHDNSVRFGQTVDMGFGPNQAFPFLYSFVRPDPEFFFSAQPDKNRSIGYPVPAGSERSLYIELDPDYNFLLNHARYSVYTNVDPAVEPYQWYDNTQVDYPVTITAGVNDEIDFEETAGVPLNATVAPGTYTPLEFATAIAAALNAAGGSTYTVTFGQDPNFNRYTIESDGSSGGNIFSILWNTGANAGTSIGVTAGFSVAADDTGSLSYSSDSALGYAHWMLEPYDYQLQYGKSYLSDLEVAISVRSSQNNILYGGPPQDSNTLNPKSDGWLPVEVSSIQGYDYGNAQLKSPYLIAMNGVVQVKFYNTGDADLLVAGYLSGHKVRF